MKKILLTLLVSLVALPAVCEVTMQQLQNAVLRSEAAAQKAMPVPTEQQRQAFNALLEDAAYAMRNNDVGYLDPSHLGEALASSITRYWELEKEGHCPNEGLTNDEYRAVYYALYTWLPPAYRAGMMTFKEYSAAYPVYDWDAFRHASGVALDLVYQAVDDIAHQRNNYRYTWLMLLTH